MSSETTAQLQCLGKRGPFKVVQVPKPVIAPDQVLIRQRVIALNALDGKQRDSGFFIEHWPHVLGIEGAGVIEAVGSDVSNLKPGDEVTALEAGVAHGQPWGGAFQEHVVMPACYVAKKPVNISLEEAASLTICYNTAVCAILGGLKVPLPFLPGTSNSGQAPTSILILGGSSATGAAAIQILRLAYPSLPIYATSSPKHYEHLASLGATKLFDYNSATVVSDIKKASPESKGIDMVFDCVAAGAAQTDVCDVLDPAGSKMYAASITGKDVPVPEGVTKIEITGWSLVDLQGGNNVIPSLTKLIEEHKYKVPLPVRVVGHGLEQVPDVIDQAFSASGEKLIVTL